MKAESLIISDISRILAISDIHGCSATFRTLVEDVAMLTRDDRLFLLGDYIDRGPDSRGVVDYIISLKNQGFQVTALMGNHEDMLLRSREDPMYHRMWMVNGGRPATASFGIRDALDLSQEYLDFFLSLKKYALTDQFIFVHAGLNFESNDPFSDEEALLWTRRFEVDPVKTGNRIVIHGHTPVSLIHIQESIAHAYRDFKMNIDNGCALGGRDLYGSLCCLDAGSRRIFLQPNIDM